MVNKKNYFIGSILFFGLLLLVHVFNLRDYYTNELADFDSAISGPLLYWCYGLMSSSLLLLLVNEIIFKKWFKQVFIWFVPLGLFITFTTDVYGGIPQPGRGDTAGLLSVLFVGLTLIYVLLQKFYYKVK